MAANSLTASACPANPNIFKHEFESRNDVRDFYTFATTRCKSSLAELQAIDEVRLREVVRRLPKKYDDELHVTGPLEFKNLTVTTVLRAERVSFELLFLQIAKKKKC